MNDQTLGFEKKPILCLDFDGVIHSYTSGWKGAHVIPDPPVPGAMRFLRDAVDRFEVHIFSSRSGQNGGIEAMEDWLWGHLDDAVGTEAHVVMGVLHFPTEKPPALVTIDDRAICFTGDWPSLDEIANFKPWNKKP